MPGFDKLYYSSAALSGSAAFITAYIGGLDVQCETIDTVAKRTVAGAELRSLNPLETVPFLITADNVLLSEQQIILDFMIDKSLKKLAPQGRGTQFYEMKQAMGFINQNLLPSLELLSREGLQEANTTFFRALVERTFSILEEHFLVERKLFISGKALSAADIVLYTALKAAITIGIDLLRWPRLKHYYDRIDANDEVQAAQTRMLANPQSIFPASPKKKFW